jgi:hypothetical protein
MKSLNIARDLLLGERKEEIPFRPPEYRPEPERSRPKKIVVSFEEAAEKANIPSDINWKFKTDTGYSPYLGDLKTAGFVVCGTTETEHVFVAVFHWREENFFSHVDIDKYQMWVSRTPKSNPISSVASHIIKDMWSAFEHVKGWNGKVQILPPGTSFDSSLFYTKGRSVSLKDAIDIMENNPVEFGKKIDIIMELKSNPDSIHDNLIVFVINGRPYSLDAELSKILTEKSNLLSVVFGRYHYADSKKNITKIKNKKNVLGYLVKKLEGKIEDEIMSAFKKAFEQAEE